MTLRDQIKEIHSRHFNQEFHAYRQDLIPAMVNDLKMKFFDDLALVPSVVWMDEQTTAYWSLRDSVDIRAVKKAAELMASPGHLRDNTPAVE